MDKDIQTGNSAPWEKHPGGSSKGSRRPGKTSEASSSSPTDILTSLPKGGGAIQGIGEKFAANAVTGTGTMTVPIACSAGRSGFTPQLSLSYDSGAGNGPFGFGWQLSQPSVSRKTSRGLPRYADAEESDVFLLADAEDLVPAQVQDAQGKWATQILPPQTVDGKTYDIKRYRPRIEGVFSLIERWTNQADSADTFWRTISKSNVLSVYGKDSNSRIFDPQNPEHIFRWLISESLDDKGNAIAYEYKPEDGIGANLSQVHQRNRGDFDDSRRSANRYLKKIRYGNRSSLLDQDGQRAPFLAKAQLDSVQWLFEVVFDYGEHDEANPKPNDSGEWNYRFDSFSTYRAAFEIRTTRRCKRVLMFHHFPDEPGVGNDCLVASTDFTYSDELNPGDKDKPVYTFLRTVARSGYRRTGSGSYSKRSLPPVEFGYSEAVIQDRVEELDASSSENLPIGPDGVNYRWTDLHGEGIPGILSEQEGAWFYKRNLSPIREGKAGFAPMEQVAVTPSETLRAGAQFMDLAGDGLPDLVSFGGNLDGLYEHDDAEGWRPFKPFRSLPNQDMGDPNLRLIDLDGDGRADLLITEENAFVWHASLAEEGFGSARRVATALNEEEGPRIIFADGTQSLFLADLSGDGLADIVRIRNGEVSYWPNIGYGRFGSKITMDCAPWFDTPDQFDHSRLRLADIDGSGTIDIIYLHREGVRIYFNQSGNSWSVAHIVRVFPDVDNLSRVSVVDLFGNGTACLVWSSPLAGNAASPMRYVDLVGGLKPHLLTKTSNNLGAETTVTYAPSTKFYLRDKRDGKPWITRLPFPVYVVERLETFDHISRNRFVNRFEYHHGYFDGAEREFRGFGMIEQHDSESFEDYVVGVQNAEGTQELAPELFQPPVTTRSWYHTGAFLSGDRILHQFQSEYYKKEQHLPEATLPSGLTTEEMQECVRSLKGILLRREVYSFDSSPEALHPYSVEENTVEVRLIQPRDGQRHGVFMPVGRESVSLVYERNPADPRISHTFALESDEYGNASKVCGVVYGRQTSDSSLPPEVTRDQQQQHITYAEKDFTPDLMQGDPVVAYRMRVPFETRNYEITGVSADANRFGFDELKAKIAATTAIAYEEIADGVTAQRRLLSHNRILFLDNSLTPLPLGSWDSLGLTYQSYQLAFTSAASSSYYGGKISDAEFLAAGYVHFDGDAHWWIPSGTATYPSDPRANFYLPAGSKDPLGLETVTSLDKYVLLPENVQVKQAAWSVTGAINDYRVLSPVQNTDPNGNRSAVEYDELGFVIKSALLGKAGSGEGDTLADPTTRMEYELFNWMNNGKPNYVHMFAREQHGAANPRWQESYVYSNGSGGVAMTKAQAHPGKALKVNPDGTVAEIDADPRWLGNGRTILNNKGKPVKQYEPYFSTTHEYEDEKALGELGSTPLLYYDPLGRNIRTLLPNGTLAHSSFTPWLQRAFDANDTVLESAWYSDRGSPDPTMESEPLNDPERRAAWLAAKHADTPGAIHLDSLGRATYAVVDYGGGKTTSVRSESDLTGRFSKVFDQLQRVVADGITSMAGVAVQVESAEKGRRWTFPNVLGALVKTWDEHGREFSSSYDELHRPIGTFVQNPGQSRILINYVVYGDRIPNADPLDPPYTRARELNLLGAAHQIFDQAGLVRIPELDFKGSPKSIDRILAKEYKDAIDWTPVSAQPDYQAIQSAAIPLLEYTEVFSASSEYDALSRPVRVILPDGTDVVPAYNESNFLASLKAKIRGTGNYIEFLKSQDYDAKGQRRFAHYGNDVLTRYFYDPDTFRLTNLLTYKSGSDPQIESLQNLQYTYDPVGNITQIRDHAQQTKYFNNAVVKAENRYEYDAVYQLVRASGRELAGTANDSIRTNSDLDFIPQIPYGNNADAVRTYTEEYEYDLLGNIKTLKHKFKAQAGGGNGWTRHYRYAFEDTPGDRTNRLVATSVTGDPDMGPYSAGYDHDVYGNMTRMPHLNSLDWDFSDQLKRVDLGGGGTAHYVNGLGGQRVRKVTERNGNQKLEWIYLGPVQIYRRRRRDTDEIRLERWTVHIGDNAGHIAQVETKTLDADNSDPVNALNTPLIRYQYSNHLGSAVLETDEHGDPISYEEYHPYGTSSYRSSKPGLDLSLKRYRFSGKERDDDTGLYYFGARYYAAWLGRWTSSDPAGFADGFNMHRFCRNNPVTHKDPDGRRTEFIVPRNVTTIQQFESWARQEGIIYRGTPHYGIHPNIDPNRPSWRVAGWSRGQPGFGGPASPPPARPVPARGQPGNVRSMQSQPRAEYGVPGNRRTRLTENEHVAPGAQMRDVTRNPATNTSDYTNRSYRRDATVRGERAWALDKTNDPATGDNARTAALRQRGGPIDLNEDIVIPSLQNAYRSANATGSQVSQEAINRGMLNQLGNLFSTHRLSEVQEHLPSQSRWERFSERVANVGRRITYTIEGTNRFRAAGTFIGATGVTFARNLIPGFVEAEVAIQYAGVYAQASGITTGLAGEVAATAAAAPGAVAATALASGVAGYFVGDWVERAVTPEFGRTAGVASGTLAGAATGAAVGAAVGVWFFGIGAAPAAAIGGVVGGIAGFIGSFW